MERMVPADHSEKRSEKKSRNGSWECQHNAVNGKITGEYSE